MKRKKRKKSRKRNTATAPVAPRSIDVTVPRRALTPPWMLVGAFAATAAIGQPSLASPPSKLRGTARPPWEMRAADVVPSHDEAFLGWSFASNDAGGAGPAALPPGIRFDVAPGALDAAVQAFSAQAGVPVELAAAELGALRSPGVAGVFAPADALAALLEGTGATFRALGGGGFRVEPGAVSESIEVVEREELLAPKHTEPLLDTPQTITIVGADLIEAQAATSLRDVLRNVTGISIQAGEGGGGLPGDNLAIRGFAARNDIFVDGVRDFGAYSRDTYNVEQVEVSKGPASAFTGRGSTGGAINLATKSPAKSAATNVAASVGSDDYARATIDFNRPLPEGLLGSAAFRLNAVYNEGATPGRDRVEVSRYGVAPSFAAGLDGPTRFWLSGSLLEEKNLPDYGIPWVPPTNVPLAAYADQPAPVDFDNFYGLVDRDDERTETKLGTAIVEHDLAEGATLRGLVRAGRSERDSIITAPRFASNETTELNRQLQARDLDDRIVDGQLDFTLRRRTGAVGHSLIAGAEVSRETAVNRARTGPAAPLADLFDPDPDAAYDGPIEYTGARTDSAAETTAAYLFDTMQLGPRFELLAGVRYDRFEVDYDSRAVDGVVTPLGRADDMVSWRSGVVYKPRPEASLYAAYGTSFNPSAEGNTGLSLTSATVLLEPEKSRSAELGVKWELFERRLLATAALFATEKTNARTPGIDPGDPPTVLQGRQRVRGFEVGLNGSLAPGWTAFAGYTYLDSEVLESNAPAEVGNELANTPRHSLSLWTSYRFARGFELGGGAQYVDDRYNNPTNVRKAPGYWRLDATASYEVNELLTLRVNLANLADERYIDRVGGGHFVPGAGRSASLTTAFRF